MSTPPNQNSTTPLAQTLASPMPLETLLATMGFYEWKTVMASFVLPIISLIGAFFCSLSAYIFFHRKFAEPVFVYYRLLCLVFIFHLIQTIPYGLVFSPKYFPQINTHHSAIYMIYFSSMSAFLFHYEDVLQMAILLTRMKLFFPFVDKHFTAKPPRIAFALFLVCVCIDVPFVFSFRVASLGTYFNPSRNNAIETFYYCVSSEFSLSPFGKMFLAFTTFFLNVFLSLVVGVTLNIVSFVKYHTRTRQRRRDIECLQVSSVHNRPTTTREQEQASERASKESVIETNMFFMALHLSSISIVSRVFIMVAYVYYFFFNTFSDNLLILLVTFTIFTFVPTVALFVFYSFNKMFRQEFNEKILGK